MSFEHLSSAIAFHPVWCLEHNDKNMYHESGSATRVRHSWKRRLISAQVHILRINFLHTFVQFWFNTRCSFGNDTLSIFGFFLCIALSGVHVTTMAGNWKLSEDNSRIFCFSHMTECCQKWLLIKLFKIALQKKWITMVPSSPNPQTRTAKTVMTQFKTTDSVVKKKSRETMFLSFKWSLLTNNMGHCKVSDMRVQGNCYWNTMYVISSQNHKDALLED